MKDINVVTISDIHLFSPGNDTPKIIDAMDEALFKSGILTHTQVLILAGDVFDRLVLLDHPDLHIVDLWIHRLFNVCARYGIILIVLEGTPSHDARQSERFTTIHQAIESKVDFRYVDKVSIEYHAGIDANILYIPDKAHDTTYATEQVVRDLLESRGLDQVDFAVMHGMFSYQIPYGVKPEHCFDEGFYNSIVRSFMTVGHVHTASIRGKIVAQGSFDRLTHGQEEAKGFAYIEVRDNQAIPFLIENKMARIYKTVHIDGMEMEAVHDMLRQLVATLPPDACIRIMGEKSHPVFSNMDYLKEISSTVTWKKDTDSTPSAEKDKVIRASDFDLWRPVQIDRSNVIDIVMDRVKGKFSEVDCAFMREQLEELK